jgi:hypothetical protein
MTTSTYFEQFSDDDAAWLSDLENRAMDLENELAIWREARDRALADDDPGADTPPSTPPAAFRRAPAYTEPPYGRGNTPAERTPPQRASRAGQARSNGRLRPPDERTRTLINSGRRSVRRVGLRRGRKATVVMGLMTAIIVVLVMVVFRHGASWPASVGTVQTEISTACQNPNVESEPDQVNFACAKDTSQILWVFSLMTSGNDPNFSDAKSGRKGLEPISATQGGEVAWSLNLHHPYDPFNSIDSLEVAARAINNIIGGATLTGSNGAPTVQSGLESNPANCARYTGSAALITRAGFPSICAEPVTSPAGEAALVADVYQQWLVGSSTVTAQEASVLFENANNPGDPEVQAILKTLPGATP